MKQFIIEEAYLDNYKVSTYINGEFEDYGILASYEVDGYCKHLTKLGYEQAYDISVIEKEVAEALIRYEELKLCLEECRKHALIKKEN